MIIKNNLILSIIFLFLLFINVKSQITINDLTEPNQHNKYFFDCNFEFLILVTDPRSQNSTDINIYDGSNNIFPGSTRTLSNKTASLFTIKVSQPVGEYTLTIYSRTNGFPSDIVSSNLIFKCLPLLKENLTIKNLYNFTLDPFGRSTSIIKIDGLVSSIPSKSIMCSYCTILNENTQNGYYIIREILITGSSNINILIPKVLTITDYNNSPLTITQDGYYKFPSKYIELVSNLISYPSFGINGSTTLMGNLYTPLFTFSILKSIYINPFFIQLEYGLINPLFSYKLISSKGNDFYYIGNVDYISNNFEGLFITYQVGSASGSGFLNYPISTNNITNIKFSNIPAMSSSTIYHENFISMGFFGSNYLFTPIYINYHSTYTSTWPFGYISGNTKNYEYQFSFSLLYNDPSSNNTITLYSFDKIKGPSTQAPPKNNSLILPNIDSHSFIKLNDFTYILRISIKSIFPIYKITINDYKVYGIECLSSGNQYNGIFDLVVDTFNPIVKVSFNDMGYSIIKNNYFNINNLQKFITPDDVLFDYFQLTDVMALYNEVDVTNKTAGNILYLNFNGINTNTPIALFLYDSSNSYYKVPGLQSQYPTDKLFYAKYNSTIKRFQIEFTIKANYKSGILQYALLYSSEKYMYSSMLPEISQINVISKNIDQYGPIFSYIEKTYVGNSPVWKLQIKDDNNGFSNGYICVRGSIDGNLNNFTLNSASRITGDQYLGFYQILIPITAPCFEQDYIITEVLLFDNQGYNSTFSIYTSNIQSISTALTNPFIVYINDSNINRISTPLSYCSTVDLTTPTLLSLNVSKSTIDVSSANNRVVEFSMTLSSASGFPKTHSPILYLSTSSLNVIECVFNKIIPLSSSKYTFTCSVELPLGFGYPDGHILYQIYGIVNNGGSFGGFSSNSLFNQGFSYNLSTTFSNIEPVITGSSSITTDGGELWIYGKNLKNTQIQTFYNRNGQNVYESPVISINYGSAVLLTKVTPKNTVFSVISKNSNGVTSNEYKITPIPKIVSNWVPPEYIPTNPPLQCKNNCNAPLQGTCVENTGCVCNSPYVGDDCSSIVIEVPQPKLNESNPSTEIEIPNNKTINNEILFKSFVSLVALREIDISSQVINEMTFKSWVFTPINDTTYQYFTNFTLNKNDDDSSILNITVTLNWYSNETIVSFANQTITMYPSSIKYTVEISKYPFDSQLNTLQLIMSAGLSINNDDNSICSSQQFGETSSVDNSNFLKIQIDNHSLYGRLIKRCIIDGSVRSLSNEIVTNFKGTNNNKENTQYQSNSFIGINIGYYTKNVILDPDFSILIDQNRANSDSPSSICHKSGLSKAQIAGIIVGGSVVFIALLIILGAIMYRYVLCFRVIVYSIFYKKSNKISKNELKEF